MIKKREGRKYLFEKLKLKERLFQEFEMVSRDGVILRGILLNPKSEKLMIVNHGWGQTSWDDLYETLDIAKLLIEEFQYSVLFWDQRWHGLSKEIKRGMKVKRQFTFGLKEKHDLEDVIGYFRNKRNYSKISLWGRSGGAVMNAILECEVDTIMMDSLFMNVDSILANNPLIPKSLGENKGFKTISTFLSSKIVSLGYKLVKVEVDSVSVINRFRKGNLPKARKIAIGYSIYDPYIKWCEEGKQHGLLLARALEESGRKVKYIADDKRNRRNWKIVAESGEVVFWEAGNPKLKEFALNYPGLNGHLVAIAVDSYEYIEIMEKLGVIE